ncbi:aldehyde dehydrogenase family protein [Temperatibacter marinus]|uniref:Aldehyde dehydrogenase family protein n=1 Tax=Temperatibacter marinus TaxID=1456591 RepID=A0AA52HAE2_9PROT|nr:aldehyde dehydrogenase family protein [Temperatibacter marinus]WND03532.1 aldehyde dehydrogenase family protein [Temperatibacter marinus]
MTVRTFGHIIGGEEIAAQSGKTFDVLSPSTQAVIGVCADGASEDIDAAVSSARAGFKIWSDLAPKDREACLLKAADLVEKEGVERFLNTLMHESGSVLNKARGEIAYTVDLLRTAAGEVRRLYGETFPNDNPDRMSLVIREPLGVVAVVSPYNAPLALLVKMAAFPLAAGNSVVIKPSEETPMIALAFVRLLLDAGLPKNAVNIVTGFGLGTGKPLVEHEDIDAIALTGSTQTGIAVGAAGMQKMRRMQLELGGKSALIILKDSDPHKAAKIAAQGIFTHAGQICMANSRILVEQEILKDFLVAFKAEAENLPIGDVESEKSFYGPLINQAAVSKVQAHVDSAVAKGATLLTGGQLLEGLVYQPTILLETPRNCDAWREESFAPMCSVIGVSSLDHAIEEANDSPFGLSAAVLTQNISRGMRAAKEIKAGSVHIGMHAFQSNALAPIGGFGMSGIGKSGGRYSTEEFTEQKWISIEVNE